MLASKLACFCQPASIVAESAASRFPFLLAVHFTGAVRPSIVAGFVMVRASFTTTAGN